MADNSGRVRPTLKKVHFLKEKDAGFGDPDSAWKECCAWQSQWDGVWSTKEKLQQMMTTYKKQRAINMVWVSNKLGGTLPEGISQMQTFQILQDLYCDTDQHDLDLEGYLEPAVSQPSNDRDSEKSRNSQLQIKQHFRAFLYLDRAVSPISEDLIKNTHKILMSGLCFEGSSTPVPAGVYREGAVHAGDHIFPSHEIVPTAMKRIVKEYNDKATDPAHDPYELASWLLLEVLTIHPFMDGNGRLCRLLWCFSLLRDGLPFPLMISSGSKKAYDHYIHCILRDRRSIQKCGHLTTLTIVSIKNSWENFFSIMKYEAPTEYDQYAKMLAS